MEHSTEGPTCATLETEIPPQSRSTEDSHFGRINVTPRPPNPIQVVENIEGVICPYGEEATPVVKMPPEPWTLPRTPVFRLHHTPTVHDPSPWQST